MMDAQEERRRGAVRGWRAVLPIMAALLLVLLAIAWIQRRPLAERFVDRALAERGVAGRYRIERIGLFRQHLSGLSLGDPARPDLVARDVELTLGWRAGGPYLAGVAARGVRLRGRLADGRLSLGAVDRLLPAPSGAPFALPDIAVELDDALLDLATPAGTLRVGLAGRGRLTDGFRGRATLAAPALRQAGCTLVRLTGDLAIRIADRAPTLSGPLAAGRLDCGGTSAEMPRAHLAVRLSPTLDGWNGTARLSAVRLAGGGATLRRADAAVRFAGGPARTEGRLVLAGEGAAMAGAVARRISADGRFATGPTPLFAGDVRLSGATYPLPALPMLAGTPLAPLAGRIAIAAAGAARDFDADAVLRLTPAAARLDRLRVTARSGARASFDGTLGDIVAGRASVSGGGLPDIRARIAGDRATLRIAPVEAAGTRLVLAPVAVAWGGGTVRVATRASFDGTVGGGRVTGLAAPLVLRVGPAGAALEGGCLPVAVGRLEVAGFDFRGARFVACPTAGGATVARLALAGRSGGSPATLVADRLRYANGRFSTGAVAARIGTPDRLTMLDLATLDGTTTATGLSGRFAGARGRIGAVPLLASDGAGRWRLERGRLSLDAALRVADAAAPPRFEPLVARDLRLTLADGRIDAAATLRNPATDIAVTAVAIRHDLAAGAGDAVLAVPGLTFGDALQPERLTRLTLGIVANVRGSVRGTGRIVWTPAGITSTGAFATDGLDLAAAFGPVTGIRGTIRFDDLLALATPPGQRATIGEANPGVAVTDGVVDYQLLPGQRVRIEGGRWPFAGGTLRLMPALVDLGSDAARRLSFAVDGLDAARFVEQLGFQNIAATGTFDGVMPMVFDAAGGRIEGGRLNARAGGGTLAYVGELSQAQLGTFGKLAFDALKSIRYRTLSIGLDGAVDGEIVSRVSFAGVNQEPLEGVKTPFRRQLQRLPFVFNITVRAPFRGLIGSARGFADPTLFIKERLGVQPSESEPKP